MIYLRVRHKNSVHHPVLSEHVSTKECVSLTQKIQRTSKEHDVACQNENTAQDENPKISCRSNNKLTIPGSSEIRESS